MFIYSIKASTLKFFGALVVSAVAIIGLLVFIPGADSGAEVNNPMGDEINFVGINTNEDRLAFLAQFGWEVKPEAVTEEQVTIPAEFDRVFIMYNELQHRQGLDLSNFRRNTVTRFTYQVLNFPDYEGVVYATILVYRGQVIAGDICSADPNGFVYGFRGRE